MVYLLFFPTLSGVPTLCFQTFSGVPTLCFHTLSGVPIFCFVFSDIEWCTGLLSVLCY